MGEMDLRMRAARIAGQAELRDVRTQALMAEMDFPPVPGSRLGYELGTNFEFSLPESDAEMAVVVGQYGLTMFVESEESDERQKFASLEFSLVALYDVPMPEGVEFEPDEWEAFVQTSGQFALYPYARETASMLTTRLGVPPLTLGVLRIELDEDEVQQRS